MLVGLGPARGSSSEAQALGTVARSSLARPGTRARRIPRTGTRRCARRTPRRHRSRYAQDGPDHVDAHRSPGPSVRPASRPTPRAPPSRAHRPRPLARADQASSLLLLHLIGAISPAAGTSTPLRWRDRKPSADQRSGRVTDEVTTISVVVGNAGPTSRREINLGLSTKGVVGGAPRCRTRGQVGLAQRGPAGSRRQRGAAAGLRWHRPGAAGSRGRRRTQDRWRTPRRLGQRTGRTVWPRRRGPNRLIDLAVIVQRLARTMTADAIPGWLNAAVPVLDGQRPRELDAGGV
jgi:hypothetical protein